MFDMRYCSGTYSAGGAKLGSRRMAPDGEVTAMSYEGNEVLENGSLRMLRFEGGYVDFSGSEPRYCWYSKDHLGSVRAVADEDGNVIASYAYDPYGAEFSSSGEAFQPYKLSGEEHLSRVGLDMYDFGARMYSPSKGCWMSMDPLCEEYYDINLYVYCS